jgi:alpha-beta hydrolase superfamily lysophospholipase
MMQPLPTSPVRDTLAGVPVLVAHAAAPAASPPAVVLWLHGFRSEAAANAIELAAFAGDGFVVVGIDAVGHGARRSADLDARIAHTPGGARAVMLELAAATAAELPAVVAAIAGRGLGDPARLGIIGVSMGGYLTYRAVLTLPGLRAAVAVLGSPEWGPPGAAGADSPHRHPDAFGDVALLSVTAERDASVSPDAARRLHAALESRVGRGRGTHRYVELAGAEHLMPAADWHRAMAEARRWLREHLGPEDRSAASVPGSGRAG